MQVSIATLPSVNTETSVDNNFLEMHRTPENLA